jgi:hypothetical protein
MAFAFPLATGSSHAEELADVTSACAARIQWGPIRTDRLSTFLTALGPSKPKGEFETSAEFAERQAGWLKAQLKARGVANGVVVTAHEMDLEYDADAGAFRLGLMPNEEQRLGQLVNWRSRVSNSSAVANSYIGDTSACPPDMSLSKYRECNGSVFRTSYGISSSSSGVGQNAFGAKVPVTRISETGIGIAPIADGEWHWKEASFGVVRSVSARLPMSREEALRVKSELRLVLCSEVVSPVFYEVYTGISATFSSPTSIGQKTKAVTTRTIAYSIANVHTGEVYRYEVVGASP